MENKNAYIKINTDYSYLFFDRNTMKLLGKPKYIRVGNNKEENIIVFQPSNSLKDSFKIKKFLCLGSLQEANVINLIKDTCPNNTAGRYKANYEDGMVYINLNEKIVE